MSSGDVRVVFSGLWGLGSRVWGCGVEVRVAVESFMFMSGEDFALL